MVRQRLIVNGMVADIGDSEVSLNYESNILANVDDLTASYSYSIKLPRTLTNDRIMAQAWHMAVDSGSIHTYLPCVYELDGVQLIKARLVCNRITSEAYECNMVWGFEAIKQMKDEGKKLYELVLPDTHYGDWMFLPHAVDKRATFGNFGIAYYYSNVPASIIGAPPLQLPTVRVPYILDLIAERYGITLDMPAEAQATINSLVVALTSRVRYRDDNYPHVSMTVEGERIEGDPPTWDWNWSVNDSGRGIIEVVDGKTHKLQCDGEGVALTVHLTDNSPFYIASAVWGINYIDAIYTGGRYVLDYTMQTSRELTAGQNVALEIGSSVSPSSWMPSIGGTVTYHIEPSKNEVDAGGYPIPENLPDMTAMEFINELCAVTGCIPVQAQDDKITCVAWSRLMDDPVTIDIIGIGYLQNSASNVAQHNIYSCATSEVQTDDEAAEIVTEDDTIDYKRDRHKSLFASLDEGEGRRWEPTIPLYTWTYEDGKYNFDFNDCEPVLARLDDSVSYTDARLTRNGITWAEVLAQRYGTLANALRKPRQVHVTARLEPNALKAIDYSRAVYVPQLGAHFAIVSIDTKGDYIYNITLLKL